jgi:hypothetical protein
MKFILFDVTVFQIAPIIAQPKQESINAFLLRQMKEQKVAGLSVGIIEDGKIAKTKGYGLANRQPVVLKKIAIGIAERLPSH